MNQEGRNYGIPTQLFNLPPATRIWHSQEKRWSLGKDYVVQQEVDVICGTKSHSTGFTRHPGNERYKEYIEARLEQYAHAINLDHHSKHLKSQIVKEIVQEVRDSGGNFIRQDDDDDDNDDDTGGGWYDIGNIKAMEKTGATMRAMLAKKTTTTLKSMSSLKKAPEKL